MSRHRAIAVAAACTGVAAASSLLIAPVPDYDPWMWLLWGREVDEGTLSTVDGPAFKPLPVAVCALLAPLGEVAPVVWVVLVRAAALAAVALASVAGRDLAGGRRAAGVAAALGVAFCGGFSTYAAAGDVTGPFLALALGGVLAWRSGRPRVVLACAVGCALLRVEAWPFVLVLAVLLWRRDAGLRPALLLVGVAVPAAWFVPEWVGSGDVLRSGARARVPNPGQPALADVPALASAWGAVRLALAPLLVAAAVGAVVAARARAAGTWSVGAAGAAWIALVAAMAQAGFSGEARYALPGVALVSVAGAVALSRAPRPVVAAGLVAVALAALPRAADLPGIAARQEHQWRLAQDLEVAVARAGGRDAVLGCGVPYVGPYRAPLLAYRLHVRKSRVEPDAPPRPPGTVFRSRLEPGAPVEPAVVLGAPRRAGAWEVSATCRDGASS